MGADWRDSQIRYLVHFDDGGSGMRYRAEPLAIGDELRDGASRYRQRGARGHAVRARASERSARRARRSATSTPFANRLTGTPTRRIASVGLPIRTTARGAW